MPKNRFSVLDTQRLALELNHRFSGHFVNNVYDVNSKTFLLKLTSPGKQAELVVLESGVRFHATKFVKEKADIPSGFSMKLRKHIRQKKLLSVKQLPGDRVVDFTFGLFDKPESEYHIILELYASGNVVLTDDKYSILSLIRVFKDEEVRFAVGENYMEAIGFSQSGVKEMESVTAETLKGHIQAAISEHEAKEAAKKNEPPSKGKKGKSKKNIPTIKQTLSNRSSPVNLLGPDMIVHCILLAGFSGSEKLPDWKEVEDENYQKLAESFNINTSELYRRLADVSAKAGVLVLESKPKVKTDGEEKEEAVFYERFDPLLLEQHKSSQYTLFDTLNEAVDEYFAKIDIQKEEKAHLANQRAAAKKVEAIKSKQESRIKSLEEEVVNKQLAALAIENKIEEVDGAILVVRSAVASGMAWEELDELIAAEKSNGNPVALLIAKTQLEKNEIVLTLPNPHTTDEAEGESQEKARPLSVSVNIDHTAYANIAKLYQNKKQAVYKAQRTAEASSKVLEEAEREFLKKIRAQDMKRRKVRVQRKINWFEKFIWFVSSEGFLILSGRDAQQNEALVKRYLRKSYGDIYVHADLHGASSCIVRSPRPGVTIPPETLNQAGAMTVCQSSAWDAKIITSAWWVSADQVSKTAPTGEYLSTGSFMIRGNKNYLPPCRLELSFGFLFKLDETQESFEGRRSDWSKVDEEESGIVKDRKEEQKKKDLEDRMKHEELAVDDHDDIDDLEKPKPKVAQVVENGLQGELDTVEEAKPAVKADETVTQEEEDGAEMVAADEEGQDMPTQKEDEQVAGEDQKEDVEQLQGQDGEKEQDDEEGEEGASQQVVQEDAVVSKGRKKKLSVAQRRALRKGKPVNESNSKNPPLPPPAESGTKQPQRQQKPKRGKKGKIKKMKKKYADQTEEERRLAMIALGHRLDDDGGTKDRGNSDGDANESVIRGEDKLSKSKSNPKTHRKPGNTASNDAAVQVNDSINLKSFTNNPKEGDVLLYALPVCGPPQSTLTYKYRVKLVPGNMRKGRASKTAIELLTNTTGAKENERDLIRCINDNELVQQMKGNVKLMAPGLASATKRMNKAKKKAKQAAKKKKNAS